MVHIIINLSLSAAIAYNLQLFFNPPKFAEVSAILEPANSTRTDYRLWSAREPGTRVVVDTLQ